MELVDVHQRWVRQLIEKNMFPIFGHMLKDRSLGFRSLHDWDLDPDSDQFTLPSAVFRRSQISRGLCDCSISQFSALGFELQFASCACCLPFGCRLFMHMNKVPRYALRIICMAVGAVKDDDAY